MDKGSFSATKLISKSHKALVTRLTFNKIRKILIDRPYLQTQGQVTANKQFFKSSLAFTNISDFPLFNHYGGTNLRIWSMNMIFFLISFAKLSFSVWTLILNIVVVNKSHKNGDFQILSRQTWKKKVKS